MDAKKPPSSRRLRIGRCSEPDRIYLVTATTRERRPWFLDFGNGRSLVQALKYQQLSGNVQSLAFVIMPDHFHWLVQLGKSDRLSSVVQQVKGWSAHQILATSSARGPVWQPGFHDHAVRKEEDLRRIARYLIGNPLRARLVERAGDYPLWDAVWL